MRGRPFDCPLTSSTPRDDHGATVTRKMFDRALTRIAELEARLLALEAGRPGPRDSADVALLATIALKIGSAPWTCAELLRDAAGDADLAQALLAADITNAHELGQLLGRVAGRAIDGRLVRRGRLRRGRARWWVDVVERVEL